MSALQSVIQASMKRALDKVLPSFVEKAMQSALDSNPDRQLKEIGFRWAFALRIRHHWPDVSLKEASYWLNDYMPSKFGDPEYDWSANAARELADDYVREFGEGSKP